MMLMLKIAVATIGPARTGQVRCGATKSGVAATFLKLIWSGATTSVST